jgi:RND family efflux transporter MFP subunit
VNKIYFSIPFLLIVLIAIIFNKSENSTKTQTFATVEQKSFYLEIIERGELEASRLIQIKSKITSNKAKIIELTQEGDFVAKGEIIARFDIDPFSEDLSKWEHKLNEGESKLTKAQKELEIHKNKIQADIDTMTKAIEIAKMNLDDEKLGSGLVKLQELQQQIKQDERATQILELELKDQEKLFAKGFISKKEIQKASNALLDAKEKLLNSKANLQNYEKYTWPKNIKEKEIKLQESKDKLESTKVQNQFQLEAKSAEVSNAQGTMGYYYKEFEKAKKNIALCDVRAPIDGIVLHNTIPKNGKRSKIEIGDSIWQNQAFLRIPDTKNMIVKTKIKEVDLRYIKKDLEVDIVLDAYPKKIFKGYISYIDPVAKTSEQNINIKYFDIVIKIKKVDEILRSGMSAKISIKYDKVIDATCVPSGALFYDESGVYVLKKDGDKTKKQNVNLGKISNQFAQILSGLELGEQVVVR